MLIPIPTGGVVLVGEASICHIHYSPSPSPSGGVGGGGEKHVQTVAVLPPMHVSAWGLLDASGSRILLGDSRGSLWVLVLQRGDASNASAVTGLVLDLLGHTTIASSVTYLENGVVYIGSQYGDSQLIRLRPEADAAGSFVDVLTSYANLGPILDMCLVDGERGGNARLVTCSGAYQEGSLRVIRSGVGLHTHAALEMEVGAVH